MPRSGFAFAVALAACTPVAAPPARAPVAAVVVAPPAADLVVAADKAVRLVAVRATGLTVLRTIELPARVHALAWAGAGPVVLLDDHQIGKLGAAGFEAFPPVAETRWVVPKPNDSTASLEPPLWDLVVDRAGSVWQARCDWGVGILKNGEIDCDAWVYARVSGPLTIARVAPAAADPAPAPPVIAPAPDIHAELVGDGARTILRCTHGDTTVDYPAAEDRIELGRWAFEGVSELTWITTAPPMFQITIALASMQVHEVFEGCEHSEDYNEGELVVGPRDLVAVHNSLKLSVRQRGRELGTLDDVELLAFAPAHE